MILSYEPSISLHTQMQRMWLAVPDTDSHVTCSKLFLNCMQLQGFPIDSHTFTQVRHMIIRSSRLILKIRCQGNSKVKKLAVTGNQTQDTWLVQPALVSFPDPCTIHCWGSGNETMPAQALPLHMLTEQPPAFTILCMCTAQVVCHVPVSCLAASEKLGNWTNGMRPVAMVKLMHYHYHILLSLIRCSLVPRPPPSSPTLAVCRRNRFRVELLRISLCGWK